MNNKVYSTSIFERAFYLAFLAAFRGYRVHFRTVRFSHGVTIRSNWYIGLSFWKMISSPDFEQVFYKYEYRLY